MTASEKVAVLERMRELLADPDRVVLDPMHCFEDPDTGREIQWAPAMRHSCRVCFCGAATLAAFDVSGSIAEWEIQDVLTRKALALGIPVMAQAEREFGRGDPEDPVVVLTSALMQGRAVEVVDACLSDLGVETRTLAVAV